MPKIMNKYGVISVVAPDRAKFLIEHEEATIIPENPIIEEQKEVSDIVVEPAPVLEEATIIPEKEEVNIVENEEKEEKPKRGRPSKK